MRAMKNPWRCGIAALLILIVLCLGSVAVYRLPAVHERLAWRLANWQAQVQRALNPPEEVVFLPQGQDDPGAVETIAGGTLAAMLLSATPPPSLTPAPANISPIALTPPLQSESQEPSPTATLSPSATPAPTPIPSKVVLSGIVHEYQQFNNCGPANLAMALSYWGWQGDQRDTRAFLRPNLEVDDKNVMPGEMVAFVEGFTGLRALARFGGDLDLLKRFIAAGFPVIIEAGHHPPKDWWMGHYLVISGYDDLVGSFVTQDSLLNPDTPFLYAELSARWWRDFNYVYLVIYPAERESEVFAILGARRDEAYSYHLAQQRALAEIPSLAGRDLFFAWFNLGSSLVGLQDYAAAAQAYDQAFALYQGLSEEQRPYRLMWYQIGPYQAYYNTGRYQDVINLANTTFAWVGKAVLEESYYWRGLAYAALGESQRAIADFQKAATLNPNFALPRLELEKLGVQP
jgi:hypothetical protein